MALVKKLQPGGSLDLLNDELSKELGSYNLRSKDERKVRDALVQYRDYFASPEGKSLSIDPVANQYTVTGIGSEKFAGSTDEIRSNWISGKLKIENDEDAKSVAAAMYHNASKNLQGSSTSSVNAPTSTKTIINIGSLSDYVRDVIYGTEYNIESSFGKLKDDDERKAKVFEFAQQKINDYKSKASANADIAQYVDLDKINDIQTAITNKDWDKFLEASYKVKWEPQKFLLTDPQKQQLKSDAEVEKAKTVSDNYTKLGITDETFRGSLFSRGFTEEAPDWTPEEGMPWFTNLLKSQGAKVLYNPETKKHLVVKGNDVFNHGIGEQFSPGYGHSWKNTDEGFHFYTPEQAKFNLGAFGKDMYADKNWGREINTNLAGIVYGWSGTDESGAYNKDLLGKRDFTHTLVVENNGQKRYLIKQSDGSYKDKSTGELVPVDISGFGKKALSINNYKDMLLDTENPLSAINPKSNYSDINEALSSFTEQKYSISTKGEYDEDEMNKIASHIRFILGTSKNAVEKGMALKAYSELRELFQANEIPISDNFKGGGFVFRKQGGKIRRGQSGMTLAEYNKKYKPAKIEDDAIVAPSGKKAVSTKGTLKNMNALDYASLAGAGLAFIPGVGAIGGGISTVADLANDIQKGESLGKTAANLGLNLGFTALAFFGAGGLKSIQVGAKLAKAGKVMDAALDFGAVSKKALKLEGMAVKAGAELPAAVLGAKRVSTVSRVIPPELLAKIGTSDEVISLGIAQKSTAFNVLKEAGYIDDAGKVLTNAGGKIVNGDLVFAKAVLKSTPSKAMRLTKAITVNPVKAIGSLVFKGGEALLKNDKVRKGATIAMIGMGAKDIFDIGKTLVEAPSNLTIAEKIGRIKESDLRGAMMAGALGRGAYLGGKYKRAIKNQTEALPVSEEARWIEVNGKSYTTLGKVKLPSDSKLKKLVGKNNDEELLAKTKVEIEAKLKGTPEEKKKIMDEIFKDSKIPKIENKFKDATTGEVRLKRAANDRFDDPARSLEEYALAKKIMERGITSPGKWNARPSWLGGDRAKKYEAELKRAVKVTTPDRKAKVEEYWKLRKEPKFLPPSVKSGVVIPKPEFIKPEPHKIDKQMVKNVQRQITKGKGKKKQTYWMKDGGIIKYQNAAATQTGIFNLKNNIGKYEKEPINTKTGLPFTALEKVGNLPGQVNTDHGYEQVYLDFINTMSEDQFKKYQPEINAYTKGQGSGYEIQNLKDLQRLAQDKRYGPMHNWAFNEYNRLKGLRGADMAPMASKPMVPQTKLAVIAPVKTGGDITIQQKPGVWDQLKGKLSSTTVSNALMYLNTIATNMKVGRSEGQAIAAGLFQKPYEKHQYIRDASTNKLLAEKQAANIRSQARNIAKSSSDLDKGTAVQLQGITQGQDIIAKGQAADQAQSSAVRAAQMESDARVDITNTKTLGQNRELASEAFKNIHLVNVDQKIAQNTASNNWLLVSNQNREAAQRRDNQKKMYDAMSNVAIKEAVDKYRFELNEGIKPFEDQYKLALSRIGSEYPHKKFEDSPFYTQWQEKVASAKANADALYTPIEKMQLALQYNQPLPAAKKGGSLSKQDKLELQRDKQAAAAELKKAELVYKSILHNNEMLQKALIKVFK